MHFFNVYQCCVLPWIWNTYLVVFNIHTYRQTQNEMRSRISCLVLRRSAIIQCHDRCHIFHNLVIELSQAFFYHSNANSCSACIWTPFLLIYKLKKLNRCKSPLGWAHSSWTLLVNVLVLHAIALRSALIHTISRYEILWMCPWCQLCDLQQPYLYCNLICTVYR